MFGQDFVVDLLGLLDITTPLCELMVLSLSVDFLHWKIVFWGQRMVSWMGAMVDNLTCTPWYKKHLQDLKNYLFQEVQLFKGWHLLSKDRMVHPDYGEEAMYTWIERSLEQSMKELKKFAMDLKASSQNRLDNGTAEVLRLLPSGKYLSEYFVSLERDKSPGIRQTSVLTLFKGKKIKAVLDESKLIEMLYTLESIYTKLGPEFMLSLNTAMASGGSETIAESFYAIIWICSDSDAISPIRSWS
jgi:hypothetical protein